MTIKINSCNRASVQTEININFDKSSRTFQVVQAKRREIRIIER